MFLNRKWSEKYDHKRKETRKKRTVWTILGKIHEYITCAEILWFEYANTAWELEIVCRMGDTNKAAPSVWEESIPRLTVRPSRVRSDNHQYRTPGYIRPFVGPTGFPDFGRRGWTNQADRLPWRPYGLIRANIISEDARKNRRISENSFGQCSRWVSFRSSVLSSFFPSSSDLRFIVRLVPSQEKNAWGNLKDRSLHHIIIVLSHRLSLTKNTFYLFTWYII